MARTITSPINILQARFEHRCARAFETRTSTYSGSTSTITVHGLFVIMVRSRNPASDQAVYRGVLQRLPVEVDVCRVGDGKDRASLGSDSRLLRVVRVAHPPRVGGPPEGT